MSNTKKSLRRSIKSAQLAMREMVLFVDQVTAVPADQLTGPDQLLVDSIVDNGAGNWTINFKSKARAVYGKDLFLKGWSSKTAGIDEVQVIAVGPSSIQIEAKAAGVPTEAVLVLTIGVHDWKFEYDMA